MTHEEESKIQVDIQNLKREIDALAKCIRFLNESSQVSHGEINRLSSIIEIMIHEKETKAKGVGGKK